MIPRVLGKKYRKWATKQSELKKKVQKLRAKLERKNEQVSQLADEKEELSIQVTAMEGKIAGLVNEISILSVDIDQDRVQKEQYERDIQLLETTNKELESESDRLENDKNRITSELEKQKEEIKSLKTRCNDLDLKAGRDSENLKKLRNQCSLLQKDNHDVKAKLEAAEIQERKLRTEQMKRTTKYRTIEEDPEMKKMAPAVRERMNDGIDILCLNHDQILDNLFSNMKEIARRDPDSTQKFNAKAELNKEFAVYDEYINKVGAEVRRIRANPSISIEELGDSLAKVPCEAFMEKYGRWMNENNLE